GKIYDTAQKGFSIYEKNRNELKIDQDNNFIDNGKKKYWLSFYNVPQGKLHTLAKSGFNRVVFIPLPDYEKAGPEAMFAGYLDYLDVVEACGLKAAVDTSVVNKNNKGQKQFNLDAVPGAVADFVSKLKQHPAIWGWNIYDEPDGTAQHHPEADLPSLVNCGAAAAKKADPYHPTYVNLAHPELITRTYSKAVDYVATDPYPIPGTVTRVYHTVRRTLYDELKMEKPVEAILQAFSHPPTFLFPRPEEERAMTYLAVMGGAKCISYFTFCNGTFHRKYIKTFDKFKVSLSNGGFKHGNEYYFTIDDIYPEQWNAILKCIKEIKVLEPVILSNSVPSRIKISSSMDPSAIISDIRKFKDTYYLFAVNVRRKKTVEAVISNVSTAISELSVLFENRKLVSVKGIFNDTFRPLEVHIYEIGPEKRLRQWQAGQVPGQPKANATRTLHGVILDKNTKNPVPAAVVIAGPCSCRSDQHGRYEIDLPVGIYDLRILSRWHVKKADRVKINSINEDLEKNYELDNCLLGANASTDWKVVSDSRLLHELQLWANTKNGPKLKAHVNKLKTGLLIDVPSFGAISKRVTCNIYPTTKLKFTIKELDQCKWGVLVRVPYKVEYYMTGFIPLEKPINQRGEFEYNLGKLLPNIAGHLYNLGGLYQDLEIFLVFENIDRKQTGKLLIEKMLLVE
ncbi:MAG: hypothetical protein PHV82_17435, partial [Victivallaceae bacterium]|nr:hypothetical protein [Victivallaceae bacterium]